MDRAFLGLAGLLLRISRGPRPQEIPQSSPASPRKTQSFPPLLLSLTHFVQFSSHFSEKDFGHEISQSKMYVLLKALFVHILEKIS